MKIQQGVCVLTKEEKKEGPVRGRKVSGTSRQRAAGSHAPLCRCGSNSKTTPDRTRFCSGRGEVATAFLASA